MAIKVIKNSSGVVRMVKSYDCGCEHSLEHFIEVRELVGKEEAGYVAELPARAQPRTAAYASNAPLRRKRALA